MKRMIAAASAGLVLAAGVVFAQSPQKSGRSFLGVCEQESYRLCPGNKSISLCLIDHEEQLSPACRAVVEGWSKKSATGPSSWLGACSPDADRLCGGQPSVSRCLNEHRKEVSPACGQMVDHWSKKEGQASSQPAAPHAPAHSSTWLGVCSADAERVCHGKHSISLCMAEHKQELSPDCRRFIDGNKPKSKPKNSK
jgi:hypothetical protein